MIDYGINPELGPSMFFQRKKMPTKSHLETGKEAEGPVSFNAPDSGTSYLFKGIISNSGSSLSSCWFEDGRK